MRRTLLASLTMVGLALGALVASPGATAATPEVALILPHPTSALERLAAAELTAQFMTLFGAQVRTVASAAAVKPGTPVVLLGNPTSNSAVRDAAGPSWPKLSDQGHVLKSVRWKGRPALIVGGGSPVATLWAVYELGHHFGMRYLLSGDIPPAKKPALNLQGLNVKLEPSLKVRSWRTINDFAIGPEAWGLADQKRLLRQLAKLKFNRIVLSVYPWQPFVDYQFNGVRKQTAVSWYGYRYPIDADTPGRAVFKGATEFINPDFAGKQTYEQKIQAGTTLARGIIDEAHGLGMSAALTFSPLEFPKEFAKVLPDARKPVQLGDWTISPGAKQPPTDPTLRALTITQIDAYLKTYPTIDALYLSLPEFPDWVEHYEASWKRLDSLTGVGKSARLADLLESARTRKLTASGDRGVNALKGNITALDFFYSLFETSPGVFGVQGRKPMEVNFVQVDPALFPHLDKLLPKGVGALHLVDYTARRVVENPELLAAVPAGKVRSSMILTLADDNVGVLPQLNSAPLGDLTSKLITGGWEGYLTRYWMPGDQSPVAEFLSRASFDPKVTPRACFEDLIGAMCGPGVSERVLLGWDQVEKATQTIDRNDLGFTFPVPGMMMKHYTATPVPAWWKEVSDLYAAATDEMYRGSQRSPESGRPLIRYYAKRLEFATAYLTAVEETRRAGIAKAAGNRDVQRAHLEKAVEALYGALNSQAEVAADPSDRGVIAVLTEHAYRPLQRELESLDK